MRVTATLLCSLFLMLPATNAVAAERAAVIRAGELKAKPFVDAATTDKVAPNQAVSIVSRQGGWAQVETGGKSGWVRLLNLRLEAGAGPTRGNKVASASLLRTGSSGKTVTTGIKGVDEEDIRSATVNHAELALLAMLAVPPAEATANAREKGLKEAKVDYLEKGDRK